MPSLVDNSRTPAAADYLNAGRGPLAPVLLRIPDLQEDQSEVDEGSRGSPNGPWWQRLPSAGFVIRGLTSRIMLLAIALSAVAISYLALNGSFQSTSKTTTSSANNPSI